MATWEDGPEYAPIERPTDFADAGGRAALDGRRRRSRWPPRRPRTARSSTSRRPPVAPLETLVARAGGDPGPAGPVRRGQRGHDLRLRVGRRALGPARPRPGRPDRSRAASRSPPTPGPAGPAEWHRRPGSDVAPPPDSRFPAPGTPAWFGPGPYGEQPAPPGRVSPKAVWDAAMPGLCICLAVGGLVYVLAPILYAIAFGLSGRVKVARQPVRVAFAIGSVVLGPGRHHRDPDQRLRLRGVVGDRRRLVAGGLLGRAAQHAGPGLPRPARRRATGAGLPVDLGMSGAARPRTLAEALRTLPAAGLSRLLQERDDLADPAPRDLTELASRATTTASVTRALGRLDAWRATVAEGLAALPDPAPTDDAGRAAGPAAAGGGRGGGRPARAGPGLGRGGPAAPGPAGPRGVRAVPRRAGPAVAPPAPDAQIDAALERCGPAARTVLDRLLWSPTGQGPQRRPRRDRTRPNGSPSRRSTRCWPLELLRPLDADTVILPREVAWRLRGGRLRPRARRDHPAAARPVGPATRSWSTGRRPGAAFGLLDDLELLVESLDSIAVRPLRTGGLSTRDVTALARRLDTGRVVQGDDPQPPTSVDTHLPPRVRVRRPPRRARTRRPGPHHRVRHLAGRAGPAAVAKRRRGLADRTPLLRPVRRGGCARPGTGGRLPGGRRPARRPADRGDRGGAGHRARPGRRGRPPWPGTGRSSRRPPFDAATVTGWTWPEATWLGLVALDAVSSFAGPGRRRSRRCRGRRSWPSCSRPRWTR